MEMSVRGCTLDRIAPSTVCLRHCSSSRSLGPAITRFCGWVATDLRQLRFCALVTCLAGAWFEHNFDDGPLYILKATQGLAWAIHSYKDTGLVLSPASRAICPGQQPPLT